MNCTKSVWRLVTYSEVGHYGLVNMLDLAIGLWVIRGDLQMLEAQMNNTRCQ